MEKEKLSYATITVAELWQPSVLLRWFDVKKEYDGGFKNDKVLQQLHTSNLGNQEWRDVPIETES